MVGVIVILASAWLALMVKLELEGLTLPQIADFWFFAIVGPIVTFPIFSTVPEISKRLVEPSSPSYAVGVLALLSALSGVLAAC